MKVNNKKSVKTKAILYAAIALIYFFCTAISILQRQIICILLFALLTIALSVTIWRLQYIEIEHTSMFISIKRKHLFEESMQLLFEMPYTEIRQIEISDTRFGHQLLIVFKDKDPGTLFRFLLTGMDKPDIDLLEISIEDLPDLMNFQPMS